MKTVQETAKLLSAVIADYMGPLGEIPYDAWEESPAPGKWSKKQELGHLLDSAHNNLRRFVASRHEDAPRIVYDQEGWVKAFNYQSQDSGRLVDLWILLNKQICYVLSEMSPEDAQRNCNTGKKEEDLHTLEWLARDYVKHLLHHLHHILQLKEIPY